MTIVYVVATRHQELLMISYPFQQKNISRNVLPTRLMDGTKGSSHFVSSLPVRPNSTSFSLFSLKLSSSWSSLFFRCPLHLHPFHRQFPWTFNSLSTLQTPYSPYLSYIPPPLVLRSAPSVGRMFLHFSLDWRSLCPMEKTCKLRMIRATLLCDVYSVGDVYFCNFRL